MRIFKSNRIGRSKAQTMVEFALVLPILLVIVYGLLEVGRLIFIYSTVVTASREAARYGSATGLNDSGVVPRWRDCPGMRNAVSNVDFLRVINPANIVITIDTGPSSSAIWTNCNTPSTTPPTMNPGYRINVRVSASFIPLAAIVPLENPIPLTSTNSRTLLVSVTIMP